MTLRVSGTTGCAHRQAQDRPCEGLFLTISSCAATNIAGMASPGRGIGENQHQVPMTTAFRLGPSRGRPKEQAGLHKGLLGKGQCAVMGRVQGRVRLKLHLCSRFCRMLGVRGSRISSSLMRHRNRSVTPRMYSFGCIRLLRRFWQIRICATGAQHESEQRATSLSAPVALRMSGSPLPPC